MHCRECSLSVASVMLSWNFSLKFDVHSRKTVLQRVLPRGTEVMNSVIF